MATVTINIEDPIAADVRDSLCDRFGYDPLTDGTKMQFLKAIVARYVKREYREHKQSTAAANAAAAAGEAADAAQIT